MLTICQPGPCLPVEPQDLGDKTVETGTQQIAALGKQGVEVVAVILQPLWALYREAHLGRLPRHADPRQQLQEVGVGAIIEDDKTGVDGIAVASLIHIDGGGVTAQGRRRLEQGDVMEFVEQKTGGKPRDP